MRSSSPRCTKANGRVYNLGDSRVTGVLELADLLVDVNGEGSYRLAPLPPDGERSTSAATTPASGASERTSGVSLGSRSRKGSSRLLEFYR